MAEGERRLANLTFRESLKKVVENSRAQWDFRNEKLQSGPYRMLMLGGHVCFRTKQYRKNATFEMNNNTR